MQTDPRRKLSSAETDAIWACYRAISRSLRRVGFKTEHATRRLAAPAPGQHDLADALLTTIEQTTHVRPGVGGIHLAESVKRMD